MAGGHRAKMCSNWLVPVQMRRVARDVQGFLVVHPDQHPVLLQGGVLPHGPCVIQFTTVSMPCMSVLMCD